MLQCLLAREEILVNASEGRGATALGLAAAQGHVMLVDLLLARDDVDVNYLKEDGTTALFNACLRGQVGEVKHIVIPGNILSHAYVSRLTLSTASWGARGRTSIWETALAPRPSSSPPRGEIQ